MQKRRQTYVTFLLIIHSFSDVILISRCAVRSRHQNYWTKSRDGDIYYRSLGSPYNEITFPPSNGHRSEAGDKNIPAVASRNRDAGEVENDKELFMKSQSANYLQHIRPMLKRDTSGSKLKAMALILTGKYDDDNNNYKSNFLPRTIKPFHHLITTNSRKSVIEELNNILSGSHNSDESKKAALEAQKDKTTALFDRQVDPLLSCVEAYCSRSDWEEKEYLECISQNCLSAVDISGKRDTGFERIFETLRKQESKSSKPNFLESDRHQINNIDRSIHKSLNMDKFKKMLNITKQNSILKDKLQNLIASRHFIIGKEFDDLRQVVPYSGDYQTSEGNEVVHSPNSKDEAEDLAKQEYLEDGYDLESQVKQKIKKWLKYAILHNVASQQQPGKQRQSYEKHTNNVIDRKRRSKEWQVQLSNSSQDLNHYQNWTEHSMIQQQQSDSNIQQHQQQVNKYSNPDLFPAVELSNRLAKRGFNDVYNTCVQSNCGREGSKGLVFYSCIHHHCG